MYLLAHAFFFLTFLLVELIGFLEILSIAEDEVVVSCISINQAVLDYYPLCCSELYPGTMTSVYIIDLNRIAL